MGFLDDQMKRLKALFDDDPVAGATPPPGRRSGAARAEALAERTQASARRRRELREQLAEMLQPDGTLAGGIPKYISLRPIRDAVGERWGDVWSKIELMAQTVVRRESDGQDFSFANGEDGLIVVFTDPDLSSETADLICLAVFEDIRRYLLGETEVDVPLFDFDPRALKDDGDVLDLPIRITPKDELILRRERLKLGLAGADPADQRFSKATTARVQADAREAITPESLAIPGDRPAGEPAEGDPDWGDSRTRMAAEARLVIDRAAQPTLEPILVPGETRAEILARYSAMGRKASEFDDISVILKRFWQAGRRVVSTHLVLPRRTREDARWDEWALGTHATRLNAHAALDINTLMQGTFDMMPRFAEGARTFFLLPVAFPTLLRRADREAYFDLWTLVPAQMRKLGRFWAYQPLSEIGDLPLADVHTWLRGAGLEPVYSASLDRQTLVRCQDLRLQAVMVDCREVKAKALLAGIAEARHRKIVVYLNGLEDSAVRADAIAAGAHFLSLGLTSGLTLPDRPEPLDDAGARYPGA